MRVGDIILKDFSEKYERAKSRHLKMLQAAGYDKDPLAIEKEWLEAIDYLRGFRIIDGEYEVNALLDDGRGILCEGAQGTMLDVDYGSYPFVTSSNTVSAGAFKAYCTRVGAGPFPTELFDKTGEEIGQRGHEFGAVTGRKRRCGWIDLVALKYAVMINGANRLIMMKSDVLDNFDTIKACTAYRIDGKITDRFPFDATAVEIEPVYTEFPGWKTDLTRMKSKSEFPENFRNYIDFIEKYLGARIVIVSVGPDREQTILTENI